jgi:hypothetical protein
MGMCRSFVAGAAGRGIRTLDRYSSRPSLTTLSFAVFAKRPSWAPVGLRDVVGEEEPIPAHETDLHGAEIVTHPLASWTLTLLDAWVLGQRSPQESIRPLDIFFKSVHAQQSTMVLKLLLSPEAVRKAIGVPRHRTYRLALTPSCPRRPLRDGPAPLRPELPSPRLSALPPVLPSRLDSRSVRLRLRITGSLPGRHVHDELGELVGVAGPAGALGHAPSIARPGGRRAGVEGQTETLPNAGSR